MQVRVLRDRIERYNEGGVEGLADVPRGGSFPVLTDGEIAQVGDGSRKGPTRSGTA